MAMSGPGAANPVPISSLPQTFGLGGERSPIFLISCGQRKLDTPAPARDLYTSPRFRAARRLAEEAGARYFVVSAKHGLVPPNEVLAPYDQPIGGLSPLQRALWAASIADNLCSIGDSKSVVLLARGEYAAALEEQLSARGIAVAAPLNGISAKQETAWLSEARRFIMRRQHLSDIYNLLAAAIESGHSFLLSDLSQRTVPRKGVYVFLDDAEPNFLGEFPRIVRIGTHGVSAGSKSTLRNRLRNHLGTADGVGNHRGSIFRLHVGRALIAQRNASAAYPMWGSGQDAPADVRLSELPMERDVSSYLRRLRVVILEVDDPSSKKSLRAYVESNLIALMTEGGLPLDTSDPAWLGNWANAHAISSSGLWNVRDVGRRYDERAIAILMDRLSFRPTLL